MNRKSWQRLADLSNSMFLPHVLSKLDYYRPRMEESLKFDVQSTNSFEAVLSAQKIRSSSAIMSNSTAIWIRS